MPKSARKTTNDELYALLDSAIERHGVENVIDLLGTVCDDRHTRQRMENIADWVNERGHGGPLGVYALRLWTVAKGLSA